MKAKEKILQLVEEGKITAKEALELLEEVERHNRWPKELYKGTERFISGALKGVSTMMGKMEKGLQNLQDRKWEVDWFQSKGIKFEETYPLSTFPYEDLSFSTNQGSIHCRAVEGDEQAQLTVSVKVKNVTHPEEAQKVFGDSLSRSQTEKRFSFHVEGKQQVEASMDIVLPQKPYQRLSLQTYTGSLHMDNVSAAQARMRTSHGSIRARKGQGMKWLAQTDNGRIQYKEGDWEGLVLKTVNGSVQLSGEVRKVQCESMNGNIRVEQARQASSEVEATTQNGTVRLFYPQDVQGVYGELKTNFGRFHSDLDNVHFQSTESKTHHKHLTFQQGEEQRHHVQVTSATGSVYVTETGKGSS